MEESNKLPLKRVELSITKFNEVAIPHHLDLLRQHKTNILKYEESGAYKRVRAEQTNAGRVASQLRVLLSEMEALRRQVRVSDWPKFDSLTERSRDLTLRAIVDYLETSPLSANRKPIETPVAGSVTSSDSVGVLPSDETQDSDAPLLQLQVDDEEVSLREREAVLRGWSELQSEVRALHDAWQHIQAAALAHKEHVNMTASRIEVAADNVEVARAHLSAAEKFKAGAICAGGAVAGALAGGPVGLAVGVKAGAAVALAGSLLGYLGGKLITRKSITHANALDVNTEPHDKKD